MNEMKSHQTLDAKGLACPMPIVKTKKAIQSLEAGQVLEIQATDKGSTVDLKAWADRSGHQYLGTLTEGDVLVHYVRKSTAEEEKVEKTFPHIISNEELIEIMKTTPTAIVLDVREQAEYGFGHIPGAVSMPLGELEDRIHELEKDAQIFVICRTGNRSDMAAQKLTEHGFEKVKNVVPGMTAWTGQEVK